MTIEDCLKLTKTEEFWEVNDIGTIKYVVMRIITDYEDVLRTFDELIADN